MDLNKALFYQQKPRNQDGKMQKVFEHKIQS